MTESCNDMSPAVYSLPSEIFKSLTYGSLNNTNHGGNMNHCDTGSLPGSTSGDEICFCENCSTNGGTADAANCCIPVSPNDIAAFLNTNGGGGGENNCVIPTGINFMNHMGFNNHQQAALAAALFQHHQHQHQLQHQQQLLHHHHHIYADDTSSSYQPHTHQQFDTTHVAATNSPYDFIPVSYQNGYEIDEHTNNMNNNGNNNNACNFCCENNGYEYVIC